MEKTWFWYTRAFYRLGGAKLASITVNSKLPTRWVSDGQVTFKPSCKGCFQPQNTYAKGDSQYLIIASAGKRSNIERRGAPPVSGRSASPSWLAGSADTPFMSACTCMLAMCLSLGVKGLICQFLGTVLDRDAVPAVSWAHGVSPAKSNGACTQLTVSGLCKPSYRGVQHDAKILQRRSLNPQQRPHLVQLPARIYLP